MAWKTLLTLSVSVTLATISMAPTAVFAQFPRSSSNAGRRASADRRRRSSGVRRSSSHRAWPARPMSASEVRLLGWAPALFLAAISGRLAASVPAVVAHRPLRVRLAPHR